MLIGMNLYVSEHSRCAAVADTLGARRILDALGPNWATVHSRHVDESGRVADSALS